MLTIMRISELFVILIANAQSSALIPSFFNIGVMFPLQKNNLPSQALRHFAAIEMAFEDLNNVTDGLFDDILPHTQLQQAIRSPINGFYYGAYSAKDMLRIDSGKGIKANIGPYGNLGMQGAVPVFQEFGGVPVIGYYDRSSAMGNSIVYPNLLRPFSAMYYDAYAIVAMITRYFLWEKVTVISTTSDDGRASALIFHHFASVYKIQTLSTHTIDATQSDFTIDLLKARKIGARIFVLFVEPSVALKLIEQGQRLKVFSSKTQIIGGEGMSLSSNWNKLGLSPQNVSETLNGLIGVKFRPYAPPSAMKSNFLKRWVNRRPTNGYLDENGIPVCDTRKDDIGDSYLFQFYPNDDPTQTPICAGVNFTSYRNDDLEDELNDVMYAYDAVILTAIGLHRLVYDHGIPDPTPPQLRDYLLKSTSLAGLTGEISFMTEVDSFNVGGRSTEIFYDIVNFVPPSTINPDDPESVSWNQALPTILSWHSEKGFTPCQNLTHYVSENPCHHFYFSTPRNDMPLDTAPARMRTMDTPLQIFLRFIAAIGLFFSISILIIVYLFRSRRLVKMSQPVMTYFTLVGIILAFIRVIETTMETTAKMCVVRLWFDHMAFQLVFTTLMIRSWRVFTVTSSLKRNKIGDVKSAGIILASLVLTVILLTIVSASHTTHVKQITIVENQFEYITQSSCGYGSRGLIAALYLYDGVVLCIGLRFCWLIRNVASTVCNTATLVEGLFTTVLTLVATWTLLFVVDMNPLTSQFIVSLVISLLMCRILWVFESELMYQLMFGYELDRALILRKSAKSIFEITCWKKVNKVDTEKDIQPTSSISNLPGITDLTSFPGAVVNEERMMLKGLEKFAKMKNQGELAVEINRVKEEIKLKQVELGCLENMIFASEQESQSRKNSSQGRDDSNQIHSQESAGAGEEDQGIIKPFHPFTETNLFTGKSKYFVVDPVETI